MASNEFNYITWTVGDELRFLNIMVAHYPVKYGASKRASTLDNKIEFFKQYLRGLRLRLTGFAGTDEPLEDETVQRIRARVYAIIGQLEGQRGMVPNNALDTYLPSVQ